LGLLYRRRVAAPSLRPLGVGETLDVAIKIYTRNAGTLFRLVFFIAAPINLLSTVVEASAVSATNSVTFDNSTSQFEVHDSSLWTILAAFLVAVLLLLVATTLTSAACFKAVADAYLGEQSTWRQSLGFAARRLRSVIWVSLLGWLLVLLGTVLCILPGIYLYTCFVIVVPVLLTENVRGRKALGRARALVRGRWWKVFVIVLLGTILTSIVKAGLSALGNTVIASGHDVNTVSGFVASFVTSTIATTLTIPFTAAFVTVIYFDLRVRKEAFDLQLLARQIGVEPQGGEQVPVAPLEPLPGPAAGTQPPYWPPPPGWKPSPPDDTAR
jgi:hypothetical protein